MSSNRPLISEDDLEELAFRRCTWWSSFIENLAERDDGVEFDILSMDQQFKDDSDEDNRVDVEEAEEVQVNEDIDDINLMNMTTAEKRNTLIESEEVQDILNATRPIIEEHERKWREAGLERIMNTFDSVRIENEVGGWMRRHNKNQSFDNNDSESDSESSISDDMYHYIRSIKKNPKRRSRNYIQHYKRYQNHLQMSHKHRMLVESTMYGVYDCPCCKYKSNSRNNVLQVCCSRGNDRKRELTAVPVHECFTKHCHMNYSSSSDSDSCRERLPRRSIPYAPIIEESPLATRATFYKKSFHTKCSNRRLESMIDYKYSTPSQSNNLNRDPTYTAPSKFTNKREAAKKALSKLSTHKGTSTKSDKRNTKSKTTENGGECNETFDEDVIKAIALSLQDYETHSKQKQGLKHLETPFREALNEESSTASISSNSSNKKGNSGGKGRANKIKAQYQINRNAEERKENTFLSSDDNICNSTALNSVAARKQLYNRLPSINESAEISRSTPPHQNIERNKILQISDKKESSLNSYKMVSKLKNIYNLTVRNAVVTDRESAPIPLALQEHNKAGLETPPQVNQLKQKRVVATEPCAKKKRSAIANRRISLHDNCNASSNYSTTPKKLITTPQSGEKVQKPKRFLIYTPNQKEGRLNEYFQVTKEILSKVVGEERARGFLKYNIGRLTFPKSSTVYYCPPEFEPSSSESDDDPLLKAGCYGELYASDQKEGHDN